uniref:Uncharacterized protein n=1 Tax=Setaria italica TaxID=4555 RepID=K3YMH4_SETIT
MTLRWCGSHLMSPNSCRPPHAATWSARSDSSRVTNVTDRLNRGCNARVTCVYAKESSQENTYGLRHFALTLSIRWKGGLALSHVLSFQQRSGLFEHDIIVLSIYLTFAIKVVQYD